MLRRAGHQVTIVANGKLALESAMAYSYDVILMDLQMPEMDGIEATRRLRESESSSRSRVPIIALTAHALKHDRERCLSAGMDDYLAKPFSTEALLAKVESAARHSSVVSPGGL
jgi:CheY-like chemotaxis protein